MVDNNNTSHHDTRSVEGVHSILLNLCGKHGGNFANKPVLCASTSSSIRGRVSEDDGWSHHMRDGEVTGKDITSRSALGGLLHGWASAEGNRKDAAVDLNGLFFGRRHSQLHFHQQQQQQHQQPSPLPGTPGGSTNHANNNNLPPAFTLTPSNYLNSSTPGSAAYSTASSASRFRGDSLSALITSGNSNVTSSSPPDQ